MEKAPQVEPDSAGVGRGVLQRLVWIEPRLKPRQKMSMKGKQCLLR